MRASSGVLNITFLGTPEIVIGSAVGVGVKVGDGRLVGRLVGLVVGNGVGEAVAVAEGARLVLEATVVTVVGGISVRQAASSNNETRMIASRVIALSLSTL